MKKLITFLLLLTAMISNSHAATWVKLRDNNNSKLMLDKQSILEADKLKRAWVKIEYKSLQKNEQLPEKEFNTSKALWFFDCPAQKSATSQVFQYRNDELVYSAGIDVKSAEFIEPVPETDLDIAMRHVCMEKKPTVVKKPEVKETKPATTTKKAEEPAPPKVTPETKPEVKPETKSEAKPTINVEKLAVKNALTKVSYAKKDDAHKTHWTYEGKEGPENWGKLNTEFVTCEAGRNQSPINIENSTHASLKPLKVVQRYAVKDIVNNGHTVQANFKEGNFLILDNAVFQMKQVHFHAPSENQINGKSYPLEAHFVHADSKGNLAVIAVMFNEGKANVALESLWLQMPHEIDSPVDLKSRVLASELTPVNRTYYRFSGSLTTPPCSEGVRWLMMKTPLTASKAQIAMFEETVKHHNNRPIQPLNGRVIVE